MRLQPQGGITVTIEIIGQKMSCFFGFSTFFNNFARIVTLHERVPEPIPSSWTESADEPDDRSETAPGESDTPPVEMRCQVGGR